MSASRVGIVQDYVPKFRLAFFAGLVDHLAADDIEVVVIAGSPTGAQASRSDAAGNYAWKRAAEPRQIKRSPIDCPFYGSTRHWRDCDAIIFSLRGNSIDLNAELLKRRFTRRRVGVWGHVGAYIKDANPIDTAIERKQMRHCDHVFAYTPAGAALAVGSGVCPSDVTTVMNSTDVAETLKISEIIDPKVVQEFRDRYKLIRGKTFGYIGGIDESKQITLLRDALDLLWRRDPEIRLVVGGRGNQEHLLQSAISRQQVVPLGHAGPHEKALINHVAEAVVNPGRIGLVAVECMAMRMPILTTSWPYHAPEFDYLSENVDVFISSQTAESYANLIFEHLGKRQHQAQHSTSPAYPTIDNMIGNFASGVKRMLA